MSKVVKFLLLVALSITHSITHSLTHSLTSIWFIEGRGIEPNFTGDIPACGFNESIEENMQGTGTGQNDEALSSLLSLLRSNSSANDTEVRVSE